MIDRPKEPDLFEDAFADPFPTERPTSPNGGTLPGAMAALLRAEPAAAAGAESAEEERPTVSPPFDLEAFARRSDSVGEQAMRAHGASRANEASTKPPPLPTIPIDIDLPAAAIHGGVPGVTMRPRQITLTDPDELETARLKSLLLASEPPPRHISRPSMSRPQVREDLHADPPPAVKYSALDEEADPFPMPAMTPPPPEPKRGGRSPFERMGSSANHAAIKPATTAAAPQDPLALPLRELRDRISFGDYTGGLEAAERVLQKSPGHAEATRGAAECRAKLAHMYAARIGPMDRIPFVTVPREQLRWLSIDHRAGFLLSHVDGVSSLEMILDVSGMAQLDALRILCELTQQRVIAFR